MFYDNSEEVFPNWWDALDESTQPGGQVIAGERPMDSDGVILQSGGSNESEANLDKDNLPGEDSGPYSCDGYQYRVPAINDSRVGEAGDSAGSTVSGITQGYEVEVVRNVWEFAEVVSGNDPDLWRKDEFGNWIYRLDYGRRTSEFGWEIFDPGVGRHCQGVYAMRPMQWQSFVSQYEVMG